MTLESLFCWSWGRAHVEYDMQPRVAKKRMHIKGRARHGYVNFLRPKQIPQGAISLQN